WRYSKRRLPPPYRIVAGRGLQDAKRARCRRAPPPGPEHGKESGRRNRPRRVPGPVPGRSGGGVHLDAPALQQILQLAGLVHLADDIAAADELALDIEL